MKILTRPLCASADTRAEDTIRCYARLQFNNLLQAVLAALFVLLSTVRSLLFL